MIQNIPYTPEDKQLLSDCTICPRNCHTDRFAGCNGWCGTDAGLNIASICIHRGEEPVIGGKQGICNIFFSGCNMRCIYCQNHEISQPSSSLTSSGQKLKDVLETISGILSRGVKAVGFVSPSHMVPQVKLIIEGLHKEGLKPTIVYNTNAYDKVETIRSLSGLVDVYLPDFKYVTPGLSKAYSSAFNYPEIALKALKEMYYQKGSSLLTDQDGRAENGMLIRHLVLPGHVAESRKVLETIAAGLSTGIHISLMAQYHPASEAIVHPLLNRTLNREEYAEVVETMNSLGFRNGWVQELESHGNYRPDFRRDHPFEH